LFSQLDESKRAKKTLEFAILKRAKELQIHLSSFYPEPFRRGWKLSPYKTTMSKKV
jgi:hypothetical protein